jgi:hypothetical protein
MPTRGPSGRRPQEPETQAQPVTEHEPGQRSREPDRSPPEPWTARAAYLAAIGAIAVALAAGIWAAA